MASMESLVSGMICGVLFGFFSGQPLTILGSTGQSLKIWVLLSNINWLGQTRSVLSFKERESGQWAVYHTSPQSPIITFSYCLGTLVNFDWLVN